MAEDEGKKLPPKESAKVDTGVEMLAKAGVLDPATIQALRQGSPASRSPANMMELSADHSDQARAFHTGLAAEGIDVDGILKKISTRLINVLGSGKVIGNLRAGLKGIEGLDKETISGRVSTADVRLLAQAALFSQNLTRVAGLLDSISTQAIGKKTGGEVTAEYKAQLEKVRAVYAKSGLRDSLYNDLGNAVINSADQASSRG